jgi:glycosyltransferase involved in cell wall biosynthesis
MKKYSKKKVAIVYDRVNKWGGAERVLVALHEMFPEAPLYTSVYDHQKARWAKVFPEVKTSFLQNFPFAKSNHEFFAALMPLAFKSFDFSDFDLVISVTSEAAKGIETKLDTLHVCYCLTPTRYLWSGYNDYFGNSFLRFISRPIVRLLKDWDKKMAKRPDVIISISSEVQRRVKRYYGRNSEIIFPPVNTSLIYINEVKNRRYFLLVSRLDYGYKKIDLAVEAFNRLGYLLVVVGGGREEKRLKRLAKRNITFAGKISEKRLIKFYQNAKALIMPQAEDFGIVAVEAQSYGVPVIAYNKGGSFDTVIDGKTGVLFHHQTVGSLVQAVQKFDKMAFSERILRENAKRFSKKVFQRQLRKTLVRAYSSRRGRHASLAKVEK